MVPRQSKPADIALAPTPTPDPSPRWLQEGKTVTSVEGGEGAYTGESSPLEWVVTVTDGRSREERHLAL